MVSTFGKVRVIGQMRVQAKPRVPLHSRCVCVLVHMSASEEEIEERQRRKSNDELK